jgi:hypothetical protein
VPEAIEAVTLEHADTNALSVGASIIVHALQIERQVFRLFDSIEGV